MDIRLLLGLLAAVVALISSAALFFYFLKSKNTSNLKSALSSSGPYNSSGVRGSSQMGERWDFDDDLSGLNASLTKEITADGKPTIEQRLFQAGLYSADDLQEFRRLRIIAPLVTTPILTGLAIFFTGDALLSLLAAVFGVLMGLQIPFSLLDRKIKAQDDEILYYLPLVVEQIAIGVSSSLDVGPCISQVVSMADERDSHNPVSEILKITLAYIRSGVQMDEALSEIGKRSGHTELKHAFMALAQVARHGGEVTKQLQQLADSVSAQREAKIEGRIKRLELDATGPVAMVFLGFFIILITGFGVQIKNGLLG